jgi:pantoate--beta-alanine ligase
MRVISDLKDWQIIRSGLQGRIGFVPTMGALHAGHSSLLEKARAENDIVVLSIFVNPTQFNNPTDLERYPITVKEDLEMATAKGVDYVLHPGAKDMYPNGYKYRVIENEFSQVLCGAHRPGHFDGVLTVVMKLLQLVRPTHAYFGEKDFQQLSLIRGMVESFFMGIEIVPCPTVREADGLAMSSRNRLLSSSAREKAPYFTQVLKSMSDVTRARANLEEAGFTVDYIQEIDGRRYGAVVLDGVRLIDNVRA